MSAFILKTVEILCDILLQYIERTLPLILFGERKTIKSRRSIIRAIGTILPLPSPTRAHVNIAKWRQEVPEARALSPQCPVIEVTPSVPDQETIKHLESELELLKRQVAFILENQKNYTVPIPKNVDVAPLPPPPPPPLPPPLPTLTPLKFSKPLGVSTPKSHQKKPAAIDALINEMKSGLPKLKPIARSPGGRPIKPPKLIDDPSDILAEVLKKRFNVSQYSDDSSEISLSFTEIKKDSFQ